MTVTKFSELLQLEEELMNGSIGEVKNPISESIKEHKGTVDDPIPFPHVIYSGTVRKLVKAVYNFNESNPDYDLYNYMNVLQQHGYTDIDIISVDVTEMNEKCIMALFMALVCGERFYDGLILDAMEKGSVKRWFRRLKELVTDN